MHNSHDNLTLQELLMEFPKHLNHKLEIYCNRVTELSTILVSGKRQFKVCKSIDYSKFVDDVHGIDPDNELIIESVEMLSFRRQLIPTCQFTFVYKLTDDVTETEHTLVFDKHGFAYDKTEDNIMTTMWLQY
jgi:hypothetical protein